jgi:hypothetical protein
MSSLKHVVSILQNRPTTFDDCIAFARCKFESYFKNQILQLLHAFPLDLKLKDGCTPLSLSLPIVTSNPISLCFKFFSKH